MLPSRILTSLLALSLALQAAPAGADDPTPAPSPSPSDSPSPSPSPTATSSSSGSSSGSSNSGSSGGANSLGQAQQLQDAIDDADAALQANKISIGIWGAEAALCGLNCANYLFRLKHTASLLVQAASNVQTAIAPLSACPGVQIYVGQVGTWVSQLMAGYGQVQSEAATAAAAQASPLGASVSTGSTGPHERMSTAAKSLGVTGKAAVATASGVAAGTGVATAGITQSVCNSASIAHLTQAVTHLDSVATDFDSQIAQVIAVGAVCEVGSIGAAAWDIIKSRNLENPSKGYISAIGAAPAAVSGVQLLLAKNHVGAKTAATLGGASCWTAGLSLALVGYKIYDNTQLQKTIDDDQQKKDALHSFLDQFMNEFGVPRAYAAAAPSACSARSKDIGTLLSCAVQSDNTVHDLLESEPGKAEKLFGLVESTLGVNRAEFISTKPPTMERLAQLISQGDVQMAMRIQAQAEEQERSLALARGMTPPGPRLGVAGVTPSAPSAPGAALLSPEQLSVLHPSGDQRGPAAEPSAEGVTVEGIHANKSQSIFEIVGTRYRSSLGSVEAKGWVIPFNAYSDK